MRRGWGRTGRRELRGPTGGAVPVGEQGQGVGTGPLDLAGKLHGGHSGMGWPPSLLGSRTPTPPPGGSPALLPDPLAPCGRRCRCCLLSRGQSRATFVPPWSEWPFVLLLRDS